MPPALSSLLKEPRSGYERRARVMTGEGRIHYLETPFTTANQPSVESHSHGICLVIVIEVTEGYDYHFLFSLNLLFSFFSYSLVIHSFLILFSGYWYSRGQGAMGRIKNRPKDQRFGTFLKLSDLERERISNLNSSTRGRGTSNHYSLV